MRPMETVFRVLSLLLQFFTENNGFSCHEYTRVNFNELERIYVGKGPEYDFSAPRHAPAANLDSHLTFALKNEGLDLGVLKALFHATGPAPVEAIVRATPPAVTRDESGFSTNGCSGPRLIYPMSTREPMPWWSTPTGNGRLRARYRHAIASKTTCRDSRPSAPWSHGRILCAG
jgi:hypothetical protein